MNLIRSRCPGLLLACSVAVLLASSTMTADTLSKSMAVSATVVSGCSSLTVNSLSFGSYSSGSGAPVNATADISITCSTGVAWSVDANSGQQPDGTATYRRMSNGGGQYLNYNLYGDSGLTTVWGSGMAGGSAGPITSAGSVTLTIYGQIPPGQSPSAGTYNDIVNVTLTF